MTHLRAFQVPHPMVQGSYGDGKDHWIEYVYVEDSSDGSVVAMAKFAPTDPEA